MIEEKLFLWDANTYDFVSKPQEEWAKAIIKKRNWTEKEIVLDAGCGSGRVTKYLSKTVPKGIVYAVDNDPNMIKKAKENLGKLENIRIIKGDLTALEIIDFPIKFDIIFSNAVLHWILNHYKVFKNFYDLLKDEGELLIQCGGTGNLQNTISVFDKIKDSPEFKDYFLNWKISWNFPKIEDTKIILEEIGYKNINVDLTTAQVKFDTKSSYLKYIKTVILNPYLEYLPSANLKDKFINKSLVLIEKTFPELMWNLDYKRLNIAALK